MSFKYKCSFIQQTQHEENEGTFQRKCYYQTIFPWIQTGEYPERDFFFAILNTLYPQGVDHLVDAAYKACKVHFKSQEDDMIQFTNELKEEIKNVVVYKSMQLSKIIVYSNTW